MLTFFLQHSDVIDSAQDIAIATSKGKIANLEVVNEDHSVEIAELWVGCCLCL